MHYIKIAETSDMGTALVMRSLLESESFDVQDVSMAGHISLAGADQGFFVAVNIDEADAARTLLRECDFEQFIIPVQATTQ